MDEGDYFRVYADFLKYRGSDMRILVTGGLGHIGSKFIRSIPFVYPGRKS